MLVLKEAALLYSLYHIKLLTLRNSIATYWTFCTAVRDFYFQRKQKRSFIITCQIIPKPHENQIALSIYLD